MTEVTPLAEAQAYVTRLESETAQAKENARQSSESARAVLSSLRTLREENIRLNAVLVEKDRAIIDLQAENGALKENVVKQQELVESAARLGHAAVSARQETEKLLQVSESQILDLVKALDALLEAKA